MNAQLLRPLAALIAGALTASSAGAVPLERTPCPLPVAAKPAAVPVDRRALGDQELTPPTLENPTAETRDLYLRLKQNEVLRSALFGQQHASWQGVPGNRKEFGSDIYDGLARQISERPHLVPAHPQVFGWNYESYRSLLASGKADEAQRMLDRMIETDAKGGITTIHWPAENFVVCGGENCDDNTNVKDVDPVEYIVNNYQAFDGSCSGDKFDAWVDDLATFLGKLKQGDKPIPVILRPFHEMNGRGGLTAHWWAGKNPAQFSKMWQRLVDRLRNDRGLRHVLIAFGPRAEPLLESGYGVYWPEGLKTDQAALRYVDIAGFDFYLDYTGTNPDLDALETKKLGDAIDATRAFAKSTARSVKRVVAITEIGRKDGTSHPADGDGFIGFWMRGVKPALDGRLPPQIPGELGKTRWEGIAYLLTWTNSAASNFSIDPTVTNSDKDATRRAVNRDFADWFQLKETLFMKLN